MIQKPFSAKLTKEREQQLLDTLLEMSLELFPGNVRITFEADCEVPDDEYFVFHVVPTGTVEEMSANVVEWHKRVARIAPDAPGRFRMSLSVA